MTGTALVPTFTVACALLVLAGVSKMRSPLAARQALRELGVGVPPILIRVLGAGELGWGVLAALRPGPVPAAGIALAIITVVNNLGTAISGKFSSISASLGSG